MDDRGEVTPPSEQQHAPWLPIPSRAISVVEHPCIVKNVDKGITSLGGPVKLSKVGRRGPNTCKRRLTHCSGSAIETGRDHRGRERGRTQAAHFCLTSARRSLREETSLHGSHDQQPLAESDRAKANRAETQARDFRTFLVGRSNRRHPGRFYLWSYTSSQQHIHRRLNYIPEPPRQ
jgi:hypothetical protein